MALESVKVSLRMGKDTVRATVSAKRWRAPGFGWIAKLLNATAPQYGPDTPHVDEAEARRAIKLFGGGRIVETYEIEHVPGRVY